MHKIDNKIFISYKRKDKDKVFPIKEQIEGIIGGNCWIDIDGIESDAQFVSVIIKAIKECEIFLFMYSAIHSELTDFDKDWTVRELQYAERLNKKIVFVNLDKSDLGDWFSFMFGQKQQVDALSYDALTRLINDLKNWLNITGTIINSNSEEDDERNKEEENEKITNQAKDKKDLKREKRTKGLKPKENNSDRKEFDSFKELFPESEYSYDFIVTGVTIKKNVNNSKRGIISFSECKRQDDGKIIGNLYFLRLSKNLDLLDKMNITYSLAWNGVPFVRDITIEEGKEIIKSIFEDLDGFLSKDTGLIKKNHSTSEIRVHDIQKNPSKVGKVNTSLALPKVEIKNIKFSTDGSKIIMVEMDIISDIKGKYSVWLTCRGRFIHLDCPMEAGVLYHINFDVKAELLNLNSKSDNKLDFKIKIEKRKKLCEIDKSITVYYETHIFSKNVIRIIQ